MLRCMQRSLFSELRRSWTQWPLLWEWGGSSRDTDIVSSKLFYRCQPPHPQWSWCRHGDHSTRRWWGWCWQWPRVYPDQSHSRGSCTNHRVCTPWRWCSTAWILQYHRQYHAWVFNINTFNTSPGPEYQPGQVSEGSKEFASHEWYIVTLTRGQEEGELTQQQPDIPPGLSSLVLVRFTSSKIIVLQHLGDQNTDDWHQQCNTWWNIWCCCCW